MGRPVAFFKVTYIISNACGYFKELGKMIRETNDRKIRQIRLGKQDHIRVQAKCDSLNENIDLGLQLCKLARDLDEIGVLIVVFFW